MLIKTQTGGYGHCLPGLDDIQFSMCRFPLCENSLLENLQKSKLTNADEFGKITAGKTIEFRKNCGDTGQPMRKITQSKHPTSFANISA